MSPSFLCVHREMYPVSCTNVSYLYTYVFRVYGEIAVLLLIIYCLYIRSPSFLGNSGHEIGAFHCISSLFAYRGEEFTNRR